MRVKQFFKKYWITILIYVGIVLLYKYIADNKLINAFLFPSVSSILDSFAENRSTMLLNMLSSFQLMVPSVALALLLSLIHIYSAAPGMYVSPFVESTRCWSGLCRLWHSLL